MLYKEIFSGIYCHLSCRIGASLLMPSYGSTRLLHLFHTKVPSERPVTLRFIPIEGIAQLK